MWYAQCKPSKVLSVLVTMIYGPRRHPHLFDLIVRLLEQKNHMCVYVCCYATKRATLVVVLGLLATKNVILRFYYNLYTIIIFLSLYPAT